MQRIYWCEFPDDVDWKTLASWIGNDRVIVYIACRSRSDYDVSRKWIRGFSSKIDVCAWPTVSFKEGYWFSGFSSKGAIDSLEQYRGIDMKIDIEPPKPPTYTVVSAFNWLVVSLFRHAPNTKYLQRKIMHLSSDSKITVSTFPFPRFVLRRWGWVPSSAVGHNFMYYRTFIPFGLLWLYDFYFRWSVRGNKDAYFAVGLTGPGIFGNEPMYDDIFQMKRDIRFLKKLGVRKFVFFELSSIVRRGKKWYDATRV